jgi:hypothetical protein
MGAHAPIRQYRPSNNLLTTIRRGRRSRFIHQSRAPYAEGVFGRTKATATPAAAEPASDAGRPAAKPDGKGRPTPKRREVEQRNRRPIVGGAAVAPGASKAERKAARKAHREAMREERAQQRRALMTGDESKLPARDRGPARRFARDYVDARHNAGEYFLFVALGAVVLSLSRATSVISILVLYGSVITVAIDSLLLRRRVQRLAEEKFGDKVAAGTGSYALMRSLQLRRARLPRPQIERPSPFRRRPRA